MMATRPELRVGDAERDTTATLLREHYAQGRLSTDELNERLDAAFSATTQGQLAEVTHDLPHVQAAPAGPRPAPRGPRPHHYLRGLGKVLTLLTVVAAVLGVVVIAQHAGAHVPRTIAELLILLLVLRAVAGRRARHRRWEHHEHHHRNGHGYRYSYRYEWDNGSGQRDEPGRNQ
jgi:Domain of unknown function (DUF1707)